MYDTYQPLLNGKHGQSTNSIFKKNEIVKSKQEMTEINKGTLRALEDMSKMYSSPKERFSFRQTQFLLEMNKLKTKTQSEVKHYKDVKESAMLSNPYSCIMKVNDMVTR